jgi:hypothetical protein
VHPGRDASLDAIGLDEKQRDPRGGGKRKVVTSDEKDASVPGTEPTRRGQRTRREGWWGGLIRRRRSRGREVLGRFDSEEER